MSNGDGKWGFGGAILGLYFMPGMGSVHGVMQEHGGALASMLLRQYSTATLLFIYEQDGRSSR